MKLTKIIFIAIFLSYFSCESPYQKGAALYVQHCSNCHGKNGEGLRKLYPPINQELYLTYSSKLPCMIRYGNKDTVTYNSISYETEMPGNADLTDIDIVNLINFLEWKYGANNRFIRLTEVKKKLEGCN